MKFRTKPVEKEAFQWRPGTPIPLDFADMQYAIGEGGLVLCINTLEGTLRASAGDWIIKGLNGEFYSCKPDIFEKTYERVT